MSPVANHVSTQAMFKLRLLALVPASLAALLNTGYQYLSRLAPDPQLAGNDLREQLSRALGANPEDPALYDYLAAGFAHFGLLLGLALLAVGIPVYYAVRGRMGRRS